MTRRILARSCAALLLALLLGTFTIHQSTASTAPHRSPTIVVGQDADGDGIPDDMDPDDDNDGAPDSDQGGEGVSSGNSPLPDADDDGITDDMDPDDNNNAVTDENEPVPASTGGGGSSSGSPSSSSPQSSGDQPLVKALPVTGSGVPVSLSPGMLASFMAIVSVSMALAAARLKTPVLAHAARRGTPNG